MKKTNYEMLQYGEWNLNESKIKMKTKITKRFYVGARSMTHDRCDWAHSTIEKAIEIALSGEGFDKLKELMK